MTKSIVFPKSITTKIEAIRYITWLIQNDLCYHFDDDAHDIIWVNTEEQFTYDQCEQLNSLRDQMYAIKDFCPFDAYYELVDDAHELKDKSYKVLVDDSGKLYNKFV